MGIGKPERFLHIPKASNYGYTWLVLWTPVLSTLIVDEIHPENHLLFHLLAFIPEVNQNDED